MSRELWGSGDGGGWNRCNINKVKRVALIILCSLLGAFTALMALGNSNDHVPVGWVAASPGYILVAPVFNHFSEWSDEDLWISAIVVELYLVRNRLTLLVPDGRQTSPHLKWNHADHGRSG